MTLLDDYEAPYKLRGIRIVAEMLQRVPNDLLKRTGVDVLLFTVRQSQLPFFILTNSTPKVLVNITDKLAQSSYPLLTPHRDPHHPRAHQPIDFTQLSRPL
jgi:hypothetical protein